MNISEPFSDKALQSLLNGLEDIDSFVFLESTRVSPENHLSYLFLDPAERLVCNPADDPTIFFRKAQEKLKQGYFLAGYLGYEFGYLLEPSLAKSYRPRPSPDKTRGVLPLVDLGVFNKPQIYNHLNGSFTESVSESGLTFTIDNMRLNLEREKYLEAIKRIKSYIATGDTYQVNYTLKLLFDFAGSISEFYRNLRRNQSVSYGGMIKNGETAILKSTFLNK